MTLECGLVTELSYHTLLTSVTQERKAANLDFHGNQFLDQVPDFDGHEGHLARWDGRFRMMIILGKKILANS